VSLEDPVLLCDYSPHWPLVFDAEASALKGVFPPDEVVVEHIGSTAVPGMTAKPIVDILLGTSSLTAVEERVEALEGLGYRYMPDSEDVLPQRRYFVKPNHGPALFHLHAVEHGGVFWRDHLAFRDALRDDLRVFEAYLALKLRVAGLFRGDRESYTDAKGPFIRAVLAGETDRI
jgi:GrpB-like predicted nucleotidyltransferase (UPF0157 family)